MSVDVIEDNTVMVVDGMNAAIRKALEEIGLLAESYAKARCPVDTGRLRNSITHVTQVTDAYIGTNVEYGPYVELGTRKQTAQPYLGPAASQHGSEYRAILKANMENG